jgi:beta-lactam-binding protein with PASTA domain
MAGLRMLGGRYELGDLLGYGGMAEVHRSRDLRLDRDVAIKVLRTDFLRDNGFQSRFRREAQNAASLNHPAIVAVYDTGDEPTADGSLPYIVMEFVEGRTLKEVLNDEGRLMPQRALEVVADACSALEFSHRNGIVHRDIKPANVMMTRGGAVKVMDFGIARALAAGASTMTQTSAVIGTAQYLSPEQARGESVDARSDVYSTGCMLYELLVGEPPFTGDNPVAVAYQHVREDPIPPSERAPDVSADMDAIVLKAMAKNPANRYQSAAEMRADLLRAAAGRKVAAPPVLSAEERTAMLAPATDRRAIPAPPSHRRRAVNWGLIALVVVTLFAVAAFGTNYLLDQRTQNGTVPSVVGLSEDEATDRLTRAGFKVEKVPQQSRENQRGKVVNQEPQANADHPRGETVTIYVGSGPKQAEVPDVIGLSRTGADTQLRQNKLVPRFETKPSSQPKDNVVETRPGAHARIAVGSTVTVYLSDGKLKEVPNLVGRQQDEAEEALTQLGLQVRVVQEPVSQRPFGEVVKQDPVGGSDVEQGALVTITVSARGTRPTPTPSGTNPSPTPTPSDSGPLPPVPPASRP